MHILWYHNYPIDVPTIKYFHKYMVEHVIIPVTIANSPLDQRLDDHALTTHTYLSVEVFDPYITTQADDIHTIACLMDNKIKSKQSSPKISTYISHLKVLNWA
jgi:hypothetical protein